MALALRPRARLCSISSRYASQTLADGGEGLLGAPGFGEKGAIKSGVTLAGFAPESGVTSLTGFAGSRFPQKRGSRSRYLLATAQRYRSNFLVWHLPVWSPFAEISQGGCFGLFLNLNVMLQCDFASRPVTKDCTNKV